MNLVYFNIKLTLKAFLKPSILLFPKNQRDKESLVKGRLYDVLVPEKNRLGGLCL